MNNGSSRLSWFCSLALRISAGVVLLLLTLAVAVEKTSALDGWLLDRVVGWRSPMADAMFQQLTWFGSFKLLGPVVLLITVWLIARRYKPEALRLAVTFYGAALTTVLLKVWVGRERPAFVDGSLQALTSDHAFPSGHATHAMAFALCLWWLSRRLQWRGQVVWAFGLFGTAGVVAFSRLYLVQHWPTDVVGGILVALMWFGVMGALERPRPAGGRVTQDLGGNRHS